MNTARLHALACDEVEPITHTERQFVYYWSRREELRQQHPDGFWVLCIGNSNTSSESWKLAVSSELEVLFEYAETNRLKGHAVVCLGYEFEPPPDTLSDSTPDVSK